MSAPCVLPRRLRRVLDDMARAAEVDADVMAEEIAAAQARLIAQGLRGAAPDPLTAGLERIAAAPRDVIRG